MNNLRILTIVIAIASILTLISCNSNADTTSMSSISSSNNYLFMDTHKGVDGLTAEAVIEAHKKDLEVQNKYGVNYVDYWFDEESGTVFCLVEAPSAEAAAKVHKEAHGLVADEIIQVKQGI